MTAVFVFVTNVMVSAKIEIAEGQVCRRVGVVQKSPLKLRFEMRYEALRSRGVAKFYQISIPLLLNRSAARNVSLTVSRTGRVIRKLNDFKTQSWSYSCNWVQLFLKSAGTWRKISLRHARVLHILFYPMKQPLFKKHGSY